MMQIPVPKVKQLTQIYYINGDIRKYNTEKHENLNVNVQFSTVTITWQEGTIFYSDLINLNVVKEISAAVEVIQNG